MRIFSKEFACAWFLSDGYLYDWAAAIILTIVNHVVPLTVMDPVDRLYTPADPTLSYPMNSGTISGSLMYVLAFLFPCVVICLFAWFRHSFHDG